MFFRKKEISGEENLRRRFHHSLLSRKRGDSLSKTIMPAHAKRSSFRKTPSAFWIVGKKVFIFAAITIGAVGIFYVVFFSSFFTVTKAVLEKNGNAVAATSLSPFLDKLKGKNLLFVDLDSLTREIEQTFEHEVLLVKIKKSPPSTLIVHVEEQPAVLNVQVITSENVTQKFIVNQIGYIIGENAEQKNLPLLIVHLPKAIQGKVVLIPQIWIDPITEAYTKFPDIFGMKITKGEWKKVERELHLTTEKNFEVWLDLTQDIDSQLSKLKRALPKLDIYHDPLAYIDLRIPGGDSEKVIFKRRK